MFRRGGRSGGLGLGEIDLELDRDLVLQLERAEEATVRLDPEGRLLHGSGSPVPAGSGLGYLQPDRLRLAVDRERALDRAAAGTETVDLRRGEAGRGATQDASHLLLDLTAVPVGERLGPARPLPDLQRAEVEVGLDLRGRHAPSIISWHLDLRRPLSYLERQVMAGLGGEPGTARLDDDTPGVRPEPEVACICSHGPYRRRSSAQRSTPAPRGTR